MLFLKLPEERTCPVAVGLLCAAPAAETFLGVAGVFLTACCVAVCGGKGMNGVNAQVTLRGDHSSTNPGLPVTGQVKQLKPTNLFPRWLTS